MSSGRKLRPIMPRPLPMPSPCSHSLTPIQPSSCTSCNFLHKSYTLSSSADLPASIQDHQSKQDDHAAASSVTPSRWNPTPEQLRALEDMYDGGTRTPTAEQIKLIAGRLSRFGKIEGKNVFYWFQNHKARERHKRRCRFGFQVGQTKNSAASNCSANSEYPLSTHRAVEASESRGWIQLEERELLQQIIRTTKNTQSKHATWQPMAKVRRTVPEEALSLSLSLAPCNYRDMNVMKLEEGGNPQTLQLFPIQNCDRKAEKRVYEVSMASSSFVPCQFFEFLPMKN